MFARNCTIAHSSMQAATMTTTEHDAYQSSCAEEFNLQLDDVRKYHARYQANMTITKEIKVCEYISIVKKIYINCEHLYTFSSASKSVSLRKLE